MLAPQNVFCEHFAGQIFVKFPERKKRPHVNAGGEISGSGIVIPVV
jgi:hypothetical protein